MKPIVSVWNRATVQLELNLAAFVTAMQQYVDQHVEPAWGVGCTLQVAAAYIPGTWGLVFLDDADAPDALAYHTEFAGMPLSKVFVRTVQSSGASLSVAASHELVEMLCDPGINLLAMGAAKVVAYESADPVEHDRYAFQVAGFSMSDFVYPAWFEDFHAQGSTQFDHQNVLHAPFTLAPGGYMSLWTGETWAQQFGSEAHRMAFAKEDRRGHRTEYRSGVTRIPDNSASEGFSSSR